MLEKLLGEKKDVILESKNIAGEKIVGIGSDMDSAYLDLCTQGYADKEDWGYKEFENEFCTVWEGAVITCCDEPITVQQVQFPRLCEKDMLFLESLFDEIEEAEIRNSYGIVEFTDEVAIEIINACRENCVTGTVGERVIVADSNPHYNYTIMW